MRHRPLRRLHSVLTPTALAALAIAAGAAGARAQPCHTWTDTLAAGPSARQMVAAAFDPLRREVVLHGGLAGFYRADTWTWDGTAWTHRDVTGPSARALHAMVFDSARGVSVLFGGRSLSVDFGDLWTWDGLAWTQLQVSGPSARFGHAMAYDAHRGVTVLFGGIPELDPDTWEWNGAEWRRIAAPGPAPRFYHAMTYDGARREVLLFGGTDLNAVLPPETWAWNGTTWTLRATSGPAPRRVPGLCFDDETGRATLFGGHDLDQGIAFGDTWEWNGAAWTQRLTQGPAERWGPLFVFDAARREGLLFGGNTSGVPQSDTWRWNSGLPRLTSEPQDLEAPPGTEATFTLTHVEQEGTTIQWRRNGVDLVDGPRISGATTATLRINPLRRTDGGVYDAVLTNACGARTTRGATLATGPGPGSVPGSPSTPLSFSGRTPPPVQHRCPADVNGDGFVDSDDVDDFLASLFRNDPAADVNADGLVDSDDALDFLNRWTEPCP